MARVAARRGWLLLPGGRDESCRRRAPWVLSGRGRRLLVGCLWQVPVVVCCGFWFVLLWQKRTIIEGWNLLLWGGIAFCFLFVVVSFESSAWRKIRAACMLIVPSYFLFSVFAAKRRGKADPVLGLWDRKLPSVDFFVTSSLAYSSAGGLINCFFLYVVMIIISLVTEKEKE